MYVKPIQPRILLADRSHTHGERQMLRGFHAIAGERNWLVLHVQTNEGVPASLEKWDPHVVVVGSAPIANLPPEIWKGRILIGMNVNTRLRKIPAVRPDDPAVGAAAANHLLAKGFKTFSTFMVNEYPWALERANSFRQTIEANGGAMFGGGVFSSKDADPANGRGLGQWVRSLPKGTAILSACDDWGALLVLACRLAGVAVPEELAVMGVDDDDLICDMCQPHLSSVRIPWQEIGRETARMVEDAIRTGQAPTEVLRLAPAGVIERRSTELTAVDHPVVAEALRYLRARAHEPLEVGEIVDHVTTNRRWLERAFRRYLGRSILQELRRAQMDRARHLLATTRLPMPAVARGCGFGDAIARFSRTFHIEVSMTPSEYRRKFALHN